MVVDVGRDSADSAVSTFGLNYKTWKNAAAAVTFSIWRRDANGGLLASCEERCIMLLDRESFDWVWVSFPSLGLEGETSHTFDG